MLLTLGMTTTKQAPHGPDCEDCTARQWFASCVVIYILSVTYLYGVVCAARRHVLWEALLTIGLPAFGYIFFVAPDNSQKSPKRMKALILIESSFNVLAVINKILIQYYGSQYNTWLNLSFVVFFGLQTYGFLSTERQYHHNFSTLRSWTLFTQICMQRWTMSDYAESDSTANIIDSAGRFLVWGEDAPANVILHYGFWVLGVLYVDYEDVLPNSATQATHLASYTVACLCGEFWHGRLLTASHLFVVDAILYFRNGITVSAAPLAIMPRSVLNHYQKHIPLVDIVSFAGCVFCMLTTVICDPHRLLCMEYDFSGPWNVM